LVVLSDRCLNPRFTAGGAGDYIDAPRLSRFSLPPGPRVPRVTASIRAEVVSRYQHGETSREVADACGIAKSTVLQILRSERVEVRPWGKRY
jgi:hypothetical protein